MDKKMKYLREMEEIEESLEIETWTAVSKAQLDEYEKEDHKEITLGDIEYKIEKYFMDENDVPTLALIAKEGKQSVTVYLSMVWSKYQNYSALDLNAREELRRKYFL